ncbi:MAG: ABC-2 transporter permease [Butyricicoccaceae bacterium]
MKSLIYKDFCALLSTLKFVIIFLLLFGILYGNFSCAFMTAYCAILATTSLNLDESTHWNRYAVILPVSRKQLVLEKYLLMLGLTFLGAAIALLRVGMGVLIGGRFSIDPMDGVITILVAACVGILMNAVSIPITFRFGIAKAKIFLIALFAVVFGGLAVVAMADENHSIPSITLSQSFVTLLPFLVIAFTIICMIVSYLISVWIFEKKEF